MVCSRKSCPAGGRTLLVAGGANPEIDTARIKPVSAASPSVAGLASSPETSRPSKLWVGRRCANSDVRGATTKAFPATGGPASLIRAPEQRSHGEDVISGSTISLTTSVTDVSMSWTAVMTSETGVAGVATGATTTGFDASAAAAVVTALAADPTRFASGAAAFVAGAAGSVVAAGEFVFVFVSDADEFVTAAVALESEPVPIVMDVTESVVAGGASATAVGAGGAAVAVGVTGSGVGAGTGTGADTSTIGGDAGTIGADAVWLVTDAAGAASDVTLVSEAAGSDCVAAATDSLSPDPGCTTFVAAAVDGGAAMDGGCGAAPKPCGVAAADPVASAFDPPLLLSVDGLSWAWVSVPLAPESAAAITPPLLPTRRPAYSKQTTATKRRCV